jgi:hypothetical protein
MSTGRDLIPLINELRSLEACGVLRHAVETARPYLDARTFPLWKRVERLADAGREREASLERALIERELPVDSLTFSPEVSFHHYSTVESLLPELRDHFEACAARYEQIEDMAGGDAKLQLLLDEHRRACLSALHEVDAILSSLPRGAAAGYKP